MEDQSAADLDKIAETLFYAEDEVISGFLKCMVVNRHSWPRHFIQDVDVFNENPNELLDSRVVYLVVVKSRTEYCGKTDGCEAGCWRIIGRDKLLKSKDTIKNRDKVVGFKKILKFCLKNKPREYKRSWVMEEYRLTKNLNRNQDIVLCKIRCMFQTEISLLLDKHFNTISESLIVNVMLPNYGFLFRDARKNYLETIMDCEGNEWPSFVTNKVYSLNPLKLVDPCDQRFKDFGICIFSNETVSTNKCDLSLWRNLKHNDGSWRNLQRDGLIKSETGETIGFQSIFVLRDTTKIKSWFVEEYRVKETAKQNKLLCVIKLMDRYEGLPKM